MKQLRQSSCEHCGRVLLFDDETATIAHQVPLCPEFEQLVQETVEEGSALLDGPVLLGFNDIRRSN